MSEATLKQFVFGKVSGTIYDFASVGDELPRHIHDERNNHITIIARGSFMAHKDNWQREVKAGDVIDWPANEYHWFIALEDNSRLVNILKG